VQSWEEKGGSGSEGSVARCGGNPLAVQGYCASSATREILRGRSPRPELLPRGRLVDIRRAGLSTPSGLPVCARDSPEAGA
jgi:hypothetical protein